MPVDHIRYDVLAQEALRGLVKRVLVDASKKGLPGDHHFFISFRTQHEGVRLSPRLREQYPEEMTIVLQHQFWDLKVTDTLFEVGLSFSGVPERLVVPLEAISAFSDPSVQFGLQFETLVATDDESANAKPAERPNVKVVEDAGKSAAKPAAKPKSKSKPPAPAPAAVPPAAATSSTDSDGPPDKPGGAEVVRLDRFRKK